MLIYSIQELDAFGAIQSSTEMSFMGKVFVRGQSLKRSMRDTIIDMARKNFRKGLPCIIVESDTVSTLWIEAPLKGKASMLQAQPNNLNVPQAFAESETNAIPGNTNATSYLQSENASAKTMVYRGQAMNAPTESYPPSSQTMPSNTPVKPQLRYRGQLVD